VRKADFAQIGDEAPATKQELSMAQLLIEQLAGDYDADDYEDDYAIALKELVEAKVSGGEVTHAPEEAEESGEVVDLLAALAKSVEKAKASRGESSDAAPAAKAPAATGAAKKAPAKKAAAKKAPAKKKAS
jgi:DNA end-binding protein Ku